MSQGIEIRNAVVLLSGGMDSSTVLAMALSQGYVCYALSIDYGQRHHAELDAAKRVTQALGAHQHKLVSVDLTSFGGSALTDDSIAVSQQPSTGIPVTYVPARNTIMLSLALAWAEVLQSQDIFIGVNAVDYSGYPDCRPEYIDAFGRMANLATKSAVEGRKFNILAPLLHLSKAEIILQGKALGVDFFNTISCYQADQFGFACGACDACRLRRSGFAAAGVEDQTNYAK